MKASILLFLPFCLSLVLPAASLDGYRREGYGEGCSDDLTWEGPFGNCLTFAPGQANAGYCVLDEACEPCGCSCAEECGGMLAAASPMLTTTPIPAGISPVTTPLPGYMDGGYMDSGYMDEGGYGEGCSDDLTWTGPEEWGGGDCVSYADPTQNAGYCVQDGGCEPCGCSCAEECGGMPAEASPVVTTTPIPAGISPVTTPLPVMDSTLFDELTPSCQRCALDAFIYNPGTSITQGCYNCKCGDGSTMCGCAWCPEAVPEAAFFPTDVIGSSVVDGSGSYSYGSGDDEGSGSGSGSYSVDLGQGSGALLHPYPDTLMPFVEGSLQHCSKSLAWGDFTSSPDFRQVY